MEEELIDHIKHKILAGQDDLVLDAEDDLLESGLIDSIAVMRLIAFIEEEYDVTVPPQDMVVENFITVQAMADYVRSRQ